VPVELPLLELLPVVELALLLLELTLLPVDELLSLVPVLELAVLELVDVALDALLLPVLEPPELAALLPLHAASMTTAHNEVAIRMGRPPGANAIATRSGRRVTSRRARWMMRRMRTLEAQLLNGRELYREVVLERLAHARESVWIATANVKAMLVERNGEYVPIVDVFADLAKRGVELRLLHAELPSRPFRDAFDKHARLVSGGLGLRTCPRVHFKAVLVDRAWLYLGSANLTGAGLGAKGDDRRNFELGFATEDFDTIDRVTAMFEAIWSGAECRTCKVRDVCPDPIGPAAKRPRKKRERRDDGGIELGRARRLRRGR